MDATTLGNFPAATVLADRLERLADPHLTRRVTKRLNDFNAGLNQLLDVPHPTYRRRLALLWRDHHLQSVAFDPTLDAYVRNVMTTFAKSLLR